MFCTRDLDLGCTVEGFRFRVLGLVFWFKVLVTGFWGFGFGLLV